MRERLNTMVRIPLCSAFMAILADSKSDERLMPN